MHFDPLKFSAVYSNTESPQICVKGHSMKSILQRRMVVLLVASLFARPDWVQAQNFVQADVLRLVQEINNKRAQRGVAPLHPAYQPVVRDLRNARTRGHTSGLTFVDLGGVIHVHIHQAPPTGGFDYDLSLRYTLLHEYKHFLDMQMLLEDGFLQMEPSRNRRTFHNRIRNHLEHRAFQQTVIDAGIQLSDPGNGLSDQQKSILETMQGRFEYLAGDHFARMRRHDLNRDHRFWVTPRRISVPKNVQVEVVFRRDFTFPHSMTFEIEVEDPDDILDMPVISARDRRFFQVHTLVRVPIKTADVSEDKLGREATITLVPAPVGLPSNRLRLENTVRVRVIGDLGKELEKEFDKIPKQLEGGKPPDQLTEDAGVQDDPPPPPDKTDGYAGKYLESGHDLAQEQMLLTDGETPSDAFILPTPEEVVEDVGLEREDDYKVAEAKIRDFLAEFHPGDDLQDLINAQRQAEAQAVRTAFATFLSALPAQQQEDLQRAHSIYLQCNKDIKPLMAAYRNVQRLSALANAYYEHGAAGLLGQGLQYGCNMFFGYVTKAVKGVAYAEGGIVGSYLAGVAGEAFTDYLCNSILPRLFNAAMTEGVGESWLTGEVIYASDPAVNEGVKLLYTGEIMSGVDRTDLPSGLDFYFRARVNNPQQLLRKFRSQDRLHDALKDHLITLAYEHPELTEYLDITDDSVPAPAIWERIYRIASEQLAMAMEAELEAQRTKVKVRDSSVFDRLEDEAKRAKENPSEYGNVRVIRERPEELGTVAHGSTVDVLTRFVVMSVAGDDETLTVRWTVRGPGLSNPPKQEKVYEFAFPETEVDAAEHLTKTGVGTFSFNTDASFRKGSRYNVYVEFVEAGLSHRIPFTIEGDGDDNAATTDRGDGSETSQGEQELPEYVWFIISIEGSGYVPHYAGGSYITDGLSEHWFRLNRDQDLKTLLLEKLAGYDRDICEIGIPAIPGLHKSPVIWNTGPQISVVDGPFIGRSDAGNREMKDTWKFSDQDGPSLSEIKKEAGCD